MYRCSSVWPGVQDRGQVSYIGISERFLPSQTADKCLPFDFFIAYVYAVQIVNIGYECVTLKGGFWQFVREKNAHVSLKNVYRRFVETGRFRALQCEKQEVPPHIFYDSDVAKWLEAAAYLQAEFPDEGVRRIVDETVDTIVRNQLPCGYFNSYYQVYAPEKIFTERTAHELYCAGHLIEAAVALDKHGVNNKLLPAMKKYADYIYERFYVLRNAGFTTCGHPEIELALVRLFQYTGEDRYLRLAKFFLDERGVREEEIYPLTDRAYDQSHMPVREQREAEGHVVRALYLYIAMADVGRLTGDTSLLETCRILFDDIVRRKLYITGGAGSGWYGERFTIPYDLPNAEAYAETCAAIALAFFCGRLSDAGNHAEYHAVFERSLYNNILSGESSDGKAFFYVNPLEADAEYAAFTHTVPGRPFKPLLERLEVFHCSCCPPNLIRFFAQLGGFVYSEEGGVLFVNQYIDSEVSACGLHLLLETDLPYSGKVSITVRGKGRFACRIPVWQTEICRKADGTFLQPKSCDDYLYFEIDGEKKIEIVFGMRPRFVYANDCVRADSGRKAVEYGPFLLCAEEKDNGKKLFDVEIPSLEHAEVERTEYGVSVRVAAQRLCTGNALYSYAPPEKESCTLTLIPYYFWANRGKNDMQVWFL